MVDLVMAAEAPYARGRSLSTHRTSSMDGNEPERAFGTDCAAFEEVRSDGRSDRRLPVVTRLVYAPRQIHSTNLAANHRRALGENCTRTEPADFILSNIAVSEEDDPPWSMRLMQVDHVANPSQSRIEEAITHARQFGATHERYDSP